MENTTDNITTRNHKPQFIPTSMPILRTRVFRRIRLQCITAIHNKRTEIKVIADTTHLIVRNRTPQPLTCLHAPPVSIHHAKPRNRHHSHHTFHSPISQCQRHILQIHQRIRRPNTLRHGTHRSRTVQPVHTHQFASVNHICIASISQQIHIIHTSHFTQLAHNATNNLFVRIRYKAVNTSCHSCFFIKIKDYNSGNQATPHLQIYAKRLKETNSWKWKVESGSLKEFFK